MNTPDPARRALCLFALAAAFATPSHALDFKWGSGTAVAGSGNLATEARQVSDFQAIATRGSVNVVVRQGAREAVEVRAEDNILPLVETVVEAGSQGRTLKIGLKKGQAVRVNRDIVVTVDVVNLSALASAGSGDVRIETLKTPTLDLSLSGSSDATIASLQAGELSVSISGSGDVSAAAGSAGKLKVSIAGSGDVKLAPLQADDVSVSIAGSGNADVTANKSLAVSIAGSGDVVYHGSGAVRKSSIAGSGSITHR